MVNCCSHSKKDKKCTRKSDKKTFKLPRRFSKKKCRKPKGFTMRSSCAPYKDCFSKQKGGGKHTAYFAGGCFWGIEDKFNKLQGVLETEVGYMGGKSNTASYKNVSSGKTKHFETVKVIYDSDKISYQRLLEEFFNMHDPTSKNKQGADIGPQYASAVFNLSPSEERQYNQMVRKLKTKLKNKIQTKKLKRKKFYQAEKYHQKYLSKNQSYKKLTTLGEQWIQAASLDMKKRIKQSGGKKEFLFNPKNPKKSFDVYIDKNPKDTISIKYKTIQDVKKTIQKLERLYKKGKYSHKRIWQVGMIMKVRLEVLKSKKKQQYQLANRYFKFLGKRTKIKDEKERKKFIFKN